MSPCIRETRGNLLHLLSLPPTGSDLPPPPDATWPLPLRAGGCRAGRERYTPLPLTLAPDDSHRTGNVEPPPPLWPPNPFMRERGPLVCPPTGHGRGPARHAASLHLQRGRRIGCHVGDVAPPSKRPPHLSPLCPPSPLCVQRGMRRGFTEGAGACKLPLHAPSPSCRVTPTCAHPR